MEREDRSRRAGTGWLGLLGAPLLAFALRVGWILSADQDPTRRFEYDMTWYHLMAGRLASGAGLAGLEGAPTAEWPPGYPALLALAYALSGGEVLAGQLLNAGLAALTVLFVYRLGVRLFGRRAGLAAALLLALCPGDIFFSPLLLSEIAFNTVLLASLALCALPHGDEPASLRQAAWLGFGLGMATLIRGAALAFLAVPLAVWAVRGRSLRAFAPHAIVACLALACVLAPWTLRNWIRLGHPILVSTSLGRTLAHAHSPVEEGRPSDRALRYRLDFKKQFAHLPQPEREVVTDRAFTRASLAFALRNPGRELALVPVRFATLYGHDHVGLEWGRERVGEDLRPVLAGVPDRWLERGADLYFYVLLLLALAGLLGILARRDRKGLLVPFGILYFTLLHSVLFPGHPRYHFPILPFLCLSAGAALGGRRAISRGDS